MSDEPAPSKRVSQRALCAAAVDYPLIRPLLVAVQLELERARQQRDHLQGLCTVAAAKIRLGDLEGAVATIDKISLAMRRG